MGTEFERRSDPVDMRRCGRTRLELDVTVRERGSTTTPARLADFSQFGCRLQGVMLAGREGQVWIKLPSLESRLAQVAWHAEDQFGLEFERPLHPAVAARFMPAQRSLPVPAAPAAPAPPDDAGSRRERLLRGIATPGQSPLQYRKQPNGLGMFGKIKRFTVRNADHRLEPRFPGTRCRARKLLSIAGVQAAIIDISASGLRVRSCAEPDIGDELPVEFAGLPALTGRLVWRKDDEMGIAMPLQSIDLLAA